MSDVIRRLEHIIKCREHVASTKHNLANVFFLGVNVKLIWQMLINVLYLLCQSYFDKESFCQFSSWFVFGVESPTLYLLWNIYNMVNY